MLSTNPCLQQCELLDDDSVDHSLNNNKLLDGVHKLWWVLLSLEGKEEVEGKQQREGVINEYGIGQ